ncbi:MAG TPA: glycosyltransferase [Mycobacteriales bacterium]|nr:glycosyltransferase [Mycobacteriales bacterium]
MHYADLPAGGEERMTVDALPRVAVCVPAYGDTAGVRTLLDSLAAVDYPRDLLHVVVAVDGPDARLEQAAAAGGATVLVLPDNRGSYAARNLALDAVGDADVVLFTDTDCAVSPQWVRAHLRALERADMSGGGVRLSADDPPAPAEWVDRARHLRQEHFVTRLHYAATCNLAVRRSVVDRLRFDESLRSGGDFEFGQRAAEAGLSIVYTPEAFITHPARATPRSVLKKVWRVAGGARDMQRAGRAATARHDPSRLRAATLARREGVRASRAWLVQVAALDYACSVAYALRVPQVVLPALRRRVARR